ncbi:MAG: trypsin-like peptidase domain-containing protein [Thermoprotei archaeon]
MPNNVSLIKKSVVLIILLILIGGIGASLITLYSASQEINKLQQQVSVLQSQINNVHQSVINQNITYILGNNYSLSQLYDTIKDSVVVISGTVLSNQFIFQVYYQVQGSGFVYNYNDCNVIITNYHVVQNAVNLTVTFINGDAYPATVLGYDPYADLAVLSINAPPYKYKSLTIVNSSSLKVGDTVIAVGNPYGLAGSMSVGIISALGRTISEQTTGGFPIANVIQITVPINPGNSGGPLLNLEGQVVGITTAIVAGSQGIGFAIPSNTILREIGDLITKGYYDEHPWLGISGVDMSYDIARMMNVNVTYGVLVVQVISGSPAFQAGLHGGNKQIRLYGASLTIGGDIIIGINGIRIRNNDDLASYLEEHTKPNQTVDLTIIRNNQKMIIPVKLSSRPSATNVAYST